MTARAEIKIESGAAVSAAVGALTPEQLTIIQIRASDAVPPRWREKFLRAVGDQLLALAHAPTNRDILEICAKARRAICVGIGPPSM